MVLNVDAVGVKPMALQMGVGSAPCDRMRSSCADVVCNGAARHAKGVVGFPYVFHTQNEFTPLCATRLDFTN